MIKRHSQSGVTPNDEARKIASMNTQHIVKVIVKTPMWRDFDYILPESFRFEDGLVGRRVVVPFGKRQIVGVISHLLDSTELDPQKLKPITDLLDEQPIMTTQVLRLCDWASHYYHYPLGEVVFTALPKKLRQLRSVSSVHQATDVLLPQSIENKTHFTLSPQQQTAIEQINAAQQFKSILLHGVTGSGKTEVYLQVIADCLRRAKQALVLVPEISLTPQTLRRFQDRFNVPIALMHSGLKESERVANWFAALNGHARIVIGTRMSVFIPFKELGIIIIDEEHDASFKQQSGFRYSARDSAIVRANFEKIAVVLGSATPSLESLNNAWQNRYDYIRLPERAGNAKPPLIKIIDIKRERLVSGMSPYLLSAIDRHLEAKGQILLFLNRRGYSPVLMCHHCGHTETCLHCDSFLTYHQAQRKVKCHHCEYVKFCPKVCEKCHQADLIPVGLGTEQIECELQERYKGYHVLRIDRDTTRKKGSLEMLLDEAHNNTAHILVGTQMLAKGHHFKNLTLVAVVDADSGLYSTDFRALERLAQLLVQVAGRAGREDNVGEVLVQTHHPEHPMLQCLLQNGFTEFTKMLALQRKAATLPPFTHMALFRSEDKNEVVAHEFLLNLKNKLLSAAHKNIAILGPIDAPMVRRAGKFRAQLLLQSNNRQALQHLLAQTMNDDWVKRQKQKIQWSLDVDPIELI